EVASGELVEEEVGGGVVQGIGAALLEHCLYDERGQLLNGNMADYLVPMAVEMPDIEVGHVVTPTADSELGAKGAGEAGTAGAPGAVMNAINDALRPLGAKPLTEMPFTPGRILQDLGRVKRVTACSPPPRTRRCSRPRPGRCRGRAGIQRTCAGCRYPTASPRPPTASSTSIVWPATSPLSTVPASTFSSMAMRGSTTMSPAAAG